METGNLGTAGSAATCDACAPSERDYQTLMAGVGYHVLEERVVVRVTGDDRASFLHGMCSNDIKNLRPGAVLYALFLTEHAHLISDFYAWARDDAILIEADRKLWPPTRAHLEKLIVADDVEMTDLDGMAVIDVEGPAAGEAVAAAVPAGVSNQITELQPCHWAEVGGLIVGRVMRFGPLGFTILADKGKTAEITGQLAGAVKVSTAALETMRIESGIARVGADATGHTIALEARLEPAISFGKGCYLGQETIERATARVGIKRRLFGLRIQGTRVPEPGAAVYDAAGKQVGSLTSAAHSPRLGVLGLSILHHSAWKPGAGMEIKDSAGIVKAVVSELPFK